MAAKNVNNKKIKLPDYWKTKNVYVESKINSNSRNAKML